MISPTLQIRKCRPHKSDQENLVRKQTKFSAEAEIKGPRKRMQMDSGHSLDNCSHLLLNNPSRTYTATFLGNKFVDMHIERRRNACNLNQYVYFPKFILRKYLEMWTDLHMKRTPTVLFKTVIKSVKSTASQLTDRK